MNGKNKEPLEPTNKKTRSEESQNTCIFKEPFHVKEPEVYEKNKRTRNNGDDINTTEDIQESDYFSFKVGEEDTLIGGSVEKEYSLGTIDSEGVMEKFNPTDLEVVSINESGEFIQEKQINNQDDETNKDTHNEEANEDDQELSGLIKNKEVIKIDKLFEKQLPEEINMRNEKKTGSQIEKENTNKPHEVETPDLPFYNTYLREPIFHEEEKEDGTSLFKHSKKNTKWSKKKKKIIAFVFMGIVVLLCSGAVVYKMFFKKNDERK